MRHSPSWESNSFSASQETPSFYGTKVYYRLRKCPPPVPVLSQLNPVHTSHPNSKQFVLILSYHLRPVSQVEFSLSFTHQNPVYVSPLPYTRYMRLPPHSYRYYHPKYVVWAVQVIKLLIVKFSSLPCHLHPHALKYSLQLLILKHPHPHSSNNASDKVSHP